MNQKLSIDIHGQDDGSPQRRSRGLVRITRSNLLLLKAALLDRDRAIAAYQEWRPTLDLETISYGQQRLLPLLQNNLARFGIEDPLADRFRGIRRYFWVRNLKAMAFAKRVFAALDNAGVPFIVLKGAALVACYFTSRSLRPMDDIDILVREDRLADAIAVLTAMNLHPDRISPRDILLNSRNNRSMLPGRNFFGPDGNIDLHWKALHLDRRPEADDRFWQNHLNSSLDGAPIRVLDPAHQLILTCAHAAQRFAAAAAEQWPADAITVIRGSADLCLERLISEARQRGLSAIIAESLDFLEQEFNVSILTTAVSRMRIASTWTERAEMRLLADPLKPTRLSYWLGELLDFRRRSPGRVSRSIPRVLPALMKSWAGVDQIIPAIIVAAQALAGRPSWLRRLLGRDRYRLIPDTDRLPKVGDTLKLDCPELEETPFIAGWSIPEPTGRWTCGHEATVAWCVKGQDQDLALFIDGIPALHEKALLQQIDLWANDQRIASWRFKLNSLSPLPARIRVPGSLIRNRDVLMLTFLIRRPVGIHAQGLHLHSLTLRAEKNWTSEIRVATDEAHSSYLRQKPFPKRIVNVSNWIIATNDNDGPA